MLRAITMTTAMFTAMLFAGGAYADGDAANGEKLMSQRCKACHTISNGDEVILKGGKTGPNLYGIIGRQAGTHEDFRYGDDLVKAGEKGLVWTPEEIDEYLEDPKKFLIEYLDDKKARSKMAFKLKKQDDRDDIAAYIATLPASN